MRPLFLVIEGLDGSGGTTQVRRLASWLRVQGAEVVETCEPSPGPIGRFIRAALSDPGSAVSDAALAWLFGADRRDHLDRVILPALARGACAVSDRYLLSSLAYQAPAVGMERVASINADFRAPDLTIFLDLDLDECLARIHARGEGIERFEARDRLALVLASYERALDFCAARGERVLRLDASGSPDEVAARVVAAVEPLLRAP